MMKFNVELICLGVIFDAAVLDAANAKAQTANAVAQELQIGNAEPEYFEVPKGHHAAMHQAVKEARKTVGKFIAALEHPAAGQQDFEAKSLSSKATGWNTSGYRTCGLLAIFSRAA